MSPVTKQILPASIEDRIELYESVCECEKEGVRFRLRREKFINYRALMGFVKNSKKEIIPSHFLFYSKLSRGFTRGKIEYVEDGIGYFNREDVIFLSIEKLNILAKTEYRDVRDLLKNPLRFEEEIRLRNLLSNSLLPTIFAIIIIDELKTEKYEIDLNSKVYEDVRENLVKIG
jgi:hypothetical protein